ncbi:hypothetical protein [Actinacidiphila paucisporea]|uniref:Uncharacterized protein n=1 Tax=Actinacidiphila paucisporea TaxID=310782 RepID=A0A1M7QUU7_9ACTN|nr:hypothetical protein [Actinacidiphila paucisporea]SHN35646.1 hypothetical protein SAMN05216499_1447 [Actinacidiphila paucisporea]
MPVPNPSTRIPEIRRLVRSSDVGADRDRWLALIAECNAFLSVISSAEDAHAEEWAQAFLEVLVAAQERRALHFPTQILKRRILLHDASISLFGVRPGDPLTDPDLIWHWFTESLGFGPAEYRHLLAAASSPERPPDDPARLRDLWVAAAIREAVLDLRRIAPAITDEALRDTSEEWRRAVVAAAPRRPTPPG